MTAASTLPDPGIACVRRVTGEPQPERLDEGLRGAVLMLFALTALEQLALAVIALTTLIRYRALVPLIYLVLLGEQLARRLIVQSYAVPHMSLRSTW